MTSYSYNENTNTLNLKIEGVIKVDVIINHYDDVINDDSYPKNLKVFIDCRKAVFDIDSQILHTTLDIVKNSIKRFESLKEAIIVETPNVAAIASLFKMLHSNVENYDFNIFNTDEAAIKWLNS